jgi:hypothetical protein
MKPVGVAGWVGWRESSLTRAKELESLYAWVRKSDQLEGYDAKALEQAIACHIEASRQAAEAAKPSGQIIAWALVFGYAQQLFTRLVDEQGRTVLESVGGASRPISTPSQP